MIGVGLHTYGQQNNKIKADTIVLKQTFVERMQKFAKKSAQKSAAEFKADKTELVQQRVFVEIKKSLQKAKLYLRTSIDTVDAQKELLSIQSHAEIAGDGVFTHTGTAHTYRNLTATAKILEALLKRKSKSKE